MQVQSAIIDRRPVSTVLVLNAGSSSLKWMVLDSTAEAVHEHGTASFKGIEHGQHAAAIAAALTDLPAVDAIGHRVVHGGARYREAILVDDQVRASIGELAELAPLHNPPALAGIEAASRRFPGIPHVACFDTAFHATLPESAALYPLPWEWTQRWGLRRFGFHGLSVQYSAGRVAEILGRVPRRLVVCHLGAGCSVTAVAEGSSVDTSMGFTPLEGLMMVHRSGSVDPGLLLHLLDQRGVSVADLDHGLNEQAGLFGVSGVSADMRAVLAAADRGHERARLAVDMFVHRAAATIGAMTATLRGLDVLVFTGGIGENAAPIRGRVTGALGYLGVDLDLQANSAAAPDLDIAAPDSAVRVLVIAAREDLVILREVKRILNW
jgi:acetate kinase